MRKVIFEVDEKRVILAVNQKRVILEDVVHTFILFVHLSLSLYV